MLKALTEQLKGKEIANTASEQEMMEIVMTRSVSNNVKPICTVQIMFTYYDACSRYEQEITHPLQNLLGGELFRAILIQVYALHLKRNLEDINVKNNELN
jgi:nuclear-control-of-ATPase protein 2